MLKNLADMENVFSGGTSLHLMVWNLFDLSIHKNGLLLMHALITSEILKDKTLLMLRPLGRVENQYYKNMGVHYGSIGNENKDFEWILIGGKRYSTYCELWIQASRDCNEEIQRTIKSWINNNSHGAAWSNLSEPIWWPYGKSLATSDYYPKTLYETQNMLKAKQIKSILGDEHIPWLLKLFWARASFALNQLIIRNGSAELIDFGTDKNVLKDLYSITFSDIDIADYSLNNKITKVSPILYGASHMAAMALCAASKNRPNYQIGQHINSHIMYPYHFSSLNLLLREFP